MKMVQTLIFLALIASSSQSIIHKRPLINTILRDSNHIEVNNILLNLVNNPDNNTNIIETPAPNIIISLSNHSNITNNSTQSTEDFPPYGYALVTIGSLGFVAFSAMGYVKIQSYRTQRRIRREELENEQKKKDEELAKIKKEIENCNEDDVVVINI